MVPVNYTMYLFNTGTLFRIHEATNDKTQAVIAITGIEISGLNVSVFMPN